MTNIGQNWPEVLLPFVNDYTIKLTASEISRKTKISRRTVSRILNELVKLNLVRYMIEGKNKKYYLDLDDQRVKLLINFVENYKSLKFSIEEKKAYLILEEMMKIKPLVLFGSYAKGNATTNSDVDILVVGKESKKIRNIARKQNKQVNLHFSTLKEFKRLLKEKNTLAKEIIKNHVIFESPPFRELCWNYYKNEIR